MSKSAIYTVNTSAQSVAVNGIINPGTVVRRFGQNISLSGNAIRFCGPGYYDIDASFTLTPTAIGTVTVTAFKDGVAIPGATASVAVAAESTPVNLSISCLTRENCACCDDASNITFVLTGVASTVNNTAIVAEKI